MNNTELEMIFQELFKELQALKIEVSNLSKPSNEEGVNSLSSQLEEIYKGLLTMNKNILRLSDNLKIEIPKIDFTPINQFRAHLNELKEIQKTPPQDQIIRHEHSFKNWQWLVVLFLFIGSTFVLSWYCLDNHDQLTDVKAKYEFVRKEIPKHIGWLDSIYQVNPEWVENFNPSKKMENKVQVKGNRKNRILKK